MPRIGNIHVSVLREESESTGQMVQALCDAYPDFLPIPLDSEGRRDGQSYRYASIAAIRRCVMPALARHGVWMQHVYGSNDESTYVVTLLRHVSGEYLTSTLRVPEISDPQERKAQQTLLCRTSIEGLLSISTEEDTDAQSTGESGVDEETQRKWTQNLALAEAAICLAKDEATLERYRAVAKKRVASGDMPPGADERVSQLVDKRLESLKENNDGDAGNEGTDSGEGEAATGSGDGRAHRGRRRVGTGA